MKPLGSKEQFDEYLDDIQEHYDANLRGRLGEEAFLEAKKDANGYCRKLIAEFYARRPDYFLGVDEKDSVIDAVLNAFTAGLYDTPEMQNIGFSWQWATILKPILGNDGCSRLQEGITEILEGTSRER